MSVFFRLSIDLWLVFNLGKSVKDFYELKRLDPSYRVFWKDQPDDIPAKIEDLTNYFESYEKGSGERLRKFLDEAKIKYEVGMGDFVTKPSLSYKEFISLDIAKKAMNLDLFKSISKHIRQHFKHPKLIELLEFPVLFLGAKPKNTPWSNEWNAHFKDTRWTNALIPQF